MKKQTVLFLHGFGQSAQIFEAKTGALRKDLIKNGFSLVFGNGLHKPRQGEGFAWWLASEDRSIYHGAAESADYIRKLHREHEFVGIFGFSQGAGFASWVATLLEPSPSFIVLCGGFLCGPTDMQRAVAGYRGSSLHIVGQSDEVIPPSVSIQLFDVYKGPKTLLEHPNGHQLPLQAAFRKEIVSWICKTADSFRHQTLKI